MRIYTPHYMINANILIKFFFIFINHYQHLFQHSSKMNVLRQERLQFFLRHLFRNGRRRYRGRTVEGLQLYAVGRVDVSCRRTGAERYLPRTVVDVVGHRRDAPVEIRGHVAVGVAAERMTVGVFAASMRNRYRKHQRQTQRFYQFTNHL